MAATPTPPPSRPSSAPSSVSPSRRSCRRSAEPVRIERSGTLDYLAAWDAQRAHAAARRGGTGGDVLMLLEHPSVYTAGRRTEPADRPTDGTPVIDVDRGGSITWHGPGQLVGYPIVGLTEPLDVVDFVRRLEQAMIHVVRGFGLAAGRVAGRSGVWLPADDRRPERKLGQIGIRVQGGVTQHGFALNCDPDMAAFDRMVPCGIADAGVSSLGRELGRPVPVAEVTDAIADAVLDVLDGRLPITAHPVARAGAPAGLDLRLDPALR